MCAADAYAALVIQLCGLSCENLDGNADADVNSSDMCVRRPSSVRLCLRPLAVGFYSAELCVASRSGVHPSCNLQQKSQPQH
jgi:hypothetical protein